jgi:hypothetical protein
VRSRSRQTRKVSPAYHHHTNNVEVDILLDGVIDLFEEFGYCFRVSLIELQERVRVKWEEGQPGLSLASVSRSLLCRWSSKR